jgi:Raf kinase inhibitor-like YbhB/YbcL family protein
MTMSLTSTAFAAGESIPTKYTCDGENLSPPLQWDQPPAGTKSLALIVEDPDAPSGTFVHWVYYDLPPEMRGLPEGVSTDENPSQGGTNGKNGANAPGYTGPCPPSGTHRYFFRLYALDTKLDAAAGLTKDALLQAMEGHVLAQGELMGVYNRSK